MQETGKQTAVPHEPPAMAAPAIVRQFIPLASSHQPGGQVSCRPPSRWKCKWSTDCPPSRPLLTTTR